MSQDSAAALSLLSLSIAAASAQPIPLPASVPDSGAGGGVTAKHPGALHHRRLSSTGRRRRLSDARDAATRPLSVGSPGLSMAALSLSTSASPPPSAVAHAMPASAPAKPMPIPIAQSPASASAGTGNGKKKRGVDHKCEACSKVGRRPSVLLSPFAHPSLSCALHRSHLSLVSNHFTFFHFPAFPESSRPARQINHSPSTTFISSPAFFHPLSLPILPFLLVRATLVSLVATPHNPLSRIFFATPLVGPSGSISSIWECVSGALRDAHRKLLWSAMGGQRAGRDLPPPLVPHQAPLGAHPALAHALVPARQHEWGSRRGRRRERGVESSSSKPPPSSRTSPPDSETGTSLPEDRGMWPRWVSGGALEGEEPGSFGSAGVPASYGSSTNGVPASYTSYTTGSSSVGGGASLSASVGAEYALRSASSGPRLHDYEVPRGAEVALRAGVVEVPHRYTSGHGQGQGGYRQTHAHTNSAGSAWSVPRSVSVSASVSSEQSRSRSTPSDDEELEGEGEGEDDEGEGEDAATGLERGEGADGVHARRRRGGTGVEARGRGGVWV
ncbi:C2H2-type domain-containing protein [Mycena venus]|uniref:C2H2-type domain-containing protein n=1 Tax=Mycena venus TaxID=2733690 RepID=A0A8H6Z0X5_9AGAR|nr:C2H2-type domain-containing protein [Mycena venus]